MGELWIILLFAYALGSISPSYFLGRKVLHEDLREEGTHNLGATNVLFNIGLTGAFFVAMFDVFKGIIPVLLAAYFNLSEPAMYAAGLCTVLGHCFPFYLGFRGGKGMSTTIGALITLWGLYLYGASLSFTFLLLVTGMLIVFYFFFMLYLTRRYQKKLAVLTRKKENLEKIEKITERKIKLNRLHQRLSKIEKEKKPTEQ